MFPNRDYFIMKLIGKDKLNNIKGVSREIDMWVIAWLTELSSKMWFSYVELQFDYPRMKIVDDEGAYIFPVASSSYNVKVYFCFNKGLALISEIITSENDHA